MSYEKIRLLAKKLFSKYLLLTNTITCGGLLAVGDCVTQNIEQLERSVIDEDGKKKKVSWNYNWKRTGRMFCMGLVLGPFNHFWYRFLDKFLVGTAGKTVGKKILCDQFVAAPFFCSSFFMGMGLMEGRGLRGSIAEVREKFLTVYMIDWCVWPPAQFINFYFLPTQLRVVYVAFITLCWNTFLSYMKHRDQVTHTHHLIDEVAESFH